MEDISISPFQKCMFQTGNYLLNSELDAKILKKSPFLLTCLKTHQFFM